MRTRSKSVTPKQHIRTDESSRGQHWVDIETAVVQFCESRTQTGGSRSASYLNGQIQLTTELKPGVQDSHCGQAYIDILGQCFDSSNHDSLSCTSADWISNSNADEFHWLWVSPNLWSNNF